MSIYLSLFIPIFGTLFTTWFYRWPSRQTKAYFKGMSVNVKKNTKNKQKHGTFMTGRSAATYTYIYLNGLNANKRIPISTSLSLCKNTTNQMYSYICLIALHIRISVSLEERILKGSEFRPKNSHFYITIAYKMLQFPV